MPKKFRNLIGASLLIASASNSYPLADAVVMDFEDKSVMSENVENLRSGLPNLLQGRLTDIFDMADIKEKIEDYTTTSIRESYPGLDYLITGSYSVINNRNVSINSRIVNLKTGKIDMQSAEGSIDDLFNLVDNIVEEMKADLGYALGENVREKPVSKPGDNERISERIASESGETGLSSKKGKWALGPLIELTFPMKPEGFKDTHNNSIAYGVEIRRSVGSNIGFSIPMVGYRLFGLDFYEALDELGIGRDEFEVFEGGTISFLSVGAGASFYPVLDNDIVPSVTAGAGYYHGKNDDLSITIDGEKYLLAEEDSDDGVGFLLRGGIEHLIGDRFSIKLSATYEHIYIGDGFDLFSIGAGINYWGSK